MSKDEALDEWLAAELPVASFNTRLVACKAWHAGVAHALAYVAGELDKNADELECFDNRTATPLVGQLRTLAEGILRMKP